MPEIRFEAKAETVAVLDGYCSATGRCRTAFINALLEEWAAKKLHEARIVVRVADSHPTAPDIGYCETFSAVINPQSFRFGVKQ